MSSVRREDRFPLLFVVNMGTDPSEKPPLDPNPSARDRNVTRGAATVISRWPQHVQTTSRLAVFTAFTIMCMSFFVVAVIFYTSDYNFGDGFGFRQDPKRRLGMCNVDKNHVYENIHEGADVDALVKFMSPLSRAWEFFSDEEKIFFVMTQGEVVTQQKRCAIESAVRVNTNSTVFLLVLIDKPQDLQGIPEHQEMSFSEVEAAFRHSIKVVYIDVIKYLKNTPLSGFWRNSGANKNLKELAAKLVTLWRFGGLAVDMNVLSLKEFNLHHHNSKKALVNMDGYVLSVRYPCHAFLFQAMKVLEKMQHGEQAMKMQLGILANDTTKDFSNGAVMTVARDVYCQTPHCVTRLDKCPGFKVIPKHVVCSMDDKPDDESCSWVSYTKQDVDKKFLKNICGYTSISL